MINHDPPLVNLTKVQWLIVDEADKLFEVIIRMFGILTFHMLYIYIK